MKTRLKSIKTLGKTNDNSFYDFCWIQSKWVTKTDPHFNSNKNLIITSSEEPIKLRESLKRLTILSELSPDAIDCGPDWRRLRLHRQQCSVLQSRTNWPELWGTHRRRGRSGGLPLRKQTQRFWPSRLPSRRGRSTNASDGSSRSL